VFEGFDLDLTGFGDLDFLNEESQNEIDDLSEKIQEQWRIEVECKNENEAQILFEKFSEEGITCKILTL